VERDSRQRPQRHFDMHDSRLPAEPTVSSGHGVGPLTHEPHDSGQTLPPSGFIPNAPMPSADRQSPPNAYNAATYEQAGYGQIPTYAQYEAAGGPLYGAQPSPSLYTSPYEGAPVQLPYEGSFVSPPALLHAEEQSPEPGAPWHSSSQQHTSPVSQRPGSRVFKIMQERKPSFYAT